MNLEFGRGYSVVGGYQGSTNSLIPVDIPLAPFAAGFMEWMTSGVKPNRLASNLLVNVNETTFSNGSPYPQCHGGCGRAVSILKESFLRPRMYDFHPPSSLAPHCIQDPPDGWS